VCVCVCVHARVGPAGAVVNMLADYVLYNVRCK
jgi:hypothetical protein